MTTCLQIFTKAPDIAPVKTRLSPSLSQKQRVDLYKKLVRHTLLTCKQFTDADIQLWVTPQADPFIEQVAEEFGASIQLQSGKDLGARMHHALKHGLRQFDRVILMGCDCPFITIEHLRCADLQLRQNITDCVIGPAADGGYVLIGNNLELPFSVFENVCWSTSTVLEHTLMNLKNAGLKTYLLETLRDIDTPGDLHHLPEHLQL